MSETMDVVVTIPPMTDEEALALAQFLKRVCWSHVRECAVDDDETRTMLAAIERVRSGLAAKGYTPR